MPAMGRNHLFRVYNKMKKCFKCKKTRGIDCFYKHPSMRDGLLGKCKECARKDAKTHREKNIESVMIYDRARSLLEHRKEERKRYKKTPLGRKIQAECGRRYKERFPQKRMAHNEVANAIRRGALSRSPCSVCGESKSHAHHDDYSRPLDVIWLCSFHHRMRHIEMELSK
jgi:hypothetical protein